jgi:hypothetical protein
VIYRGCGVCGLRLPSDERCPDHPDAPKYPAAPSEEETMSEDPFIKLPVPNGRTHDDILTPAERAYVNALSELGRDRLRVVVGELLSVEQFRIELDELMLDLEEGV